ncbi:MAG: DegT/DnrJ/EryC1/StrS family aminotransferase [Alphaproteobacteria bacterium]|nr:DegT/DnrJ/EryC1/StrS family aminotransferase [Alphaproteobacteria bacterium]
MAASQPRPIPYVDLTAQYAEEREAILAAIDSVFKGGQFVGGKEVEDFEAKAAKACGARHAIAMDSGTVALTLAMQVAGIKEGDEVITPPNSFVASTAAIVHLRAKPVFVDVRDDQNIDPDAIEAAITPRTTAIMPVHLTVRIADMAPILAIARKRGLLVIEDAAQAIGSRYDGRPAGSLGDIACFSTHPLKNLNGPGDGGFITTNDEAWADRLRRLRNHGLVDRNTVAEWGHVARMDNIQAAVLSLRIDKLDAINRRKREIAARYRELLDPSRAFIAPCRPIEFNTFQTFVAQLDRRDELHIHLAKRGIQTGIHYPAPIHLQPAARHLGHKVGDFPRAERQAKRILSLPAFPQIGDSDIRRVAEEINAFLAGA